MKKLICTMLAAALLGASTAPALAEGADPIAQVVSEYDNTLEQIEALLDMRARIDSMLVQLGAEDYEALAAASGYVDLERNAINDDVTRLQERLVELGFLRRVNGKYDNETVKAVKQFEKANGLDNDGKASIMDQIVLFSDSAIGRDGTSVPYSRSEAIEQEPEATSGPETTPEPEVTPEPETTPEPEVTSEPEVESEPNQIEPELTLTDEYAPMDLMAYAADPDAYQGAAVAIEGKVAQMLSAQDDVGALVLIAYDQSRVYVQGSPELFEGIAGGDAVCVYAHIDGTYEYATLAGEARNLPCALADAIEVLD